MCWSGEASAAVALIGIGTSIYAFRKKEPPAVWLILGYFALMELLQAYTYSVINQCSDPSNQVATLLGYLHIAFQAFFVNAFSMYFIPERIRLKIQFPVYTLCFISTLFMLIQLYPFDWAGPCDVRRPLCSLERLCSVPGNWHIAWEIPINGIGNIFQEFTQPWMYPFKNGYISYSLVVFVLPLLYGSWRFTLYHFFSGPVLSRLLSDDVNEQPAIWCLVSFAILLVAAETPLRKRMYVKSWPLWPAEKRL